MYEQISKLIVEAMKAKNKERLNALRYMKSLLLENKTSAKPIDEQEVIIKHHKKLSDSLDVFKDSQEKVDAIKAEIAVVAEFMPKPLEESDVVALIEEIKASLDNPNMGGIMKELSPKIKGKFDGKKASQLVQEALK